MTLIIVSDTETNNQSNSCKSYSVVHERSVDKGETNILIGNIHPLIRKLQIKTSLQRDPFFFVSTDEMMVLQDSSPGLYCDEPLIMVVRS